MTAFNRVRAVRIICALCLCLSASRGVLAETQAKPIAPDKGRFVLVVQEAEIGSDSFTINANGNSESNVSVALGGPAVEIHSILKATAGRLTSIMTDAGKQGKLLMTIAGEMGKMTVDNKPFKDEKLPSAVYPFGNFAPHTFAYLIAAYDRAKGGAQKFDMIVIDAATSGGLAQLKATLTALPTVNRTVSGKKIGISHYSLTLPGTIARNLNTGGDLATDTKIVVAKQTIYHTAAHASYVVLPVLPK